LTSTGSISDSHTVSSIRRKTPEHAVEHRKNVSKIQSCLLFVHRWSAMRRSPGLRTP
jgi:hypothetical protein